MLGEKPKRVCSFNGCTNVHYARDVCRGHYWQLRNGKQLKPLKKMVRRSETPDGFKYCPKCQEVLSLEYFYKAKGKYHDRSGYCKRCHKDSVNANSVSNILRQYNLTESDYDKMLASQQGVCALCGRTPEENGKRLGVDHDHSCCSKGKSCGRCVRQLLCSSCNRGLGYLKDDPELLRKAAEYIERHSRDNQLREAA